jgi:hypothetical protein
VSSILKKISPKLLDRTVYMVCACGCVFILLVCFEPAGPLSRNLTRTLRHSWPLPSHRFNFLKSATATCSMRVPVVPVFATHFRALTQFFEKYRWTICNVY